jgi:hypothetical protein
MRKNEEKITVENVNTPGRTTREDAAKYTAMRKALLSVLPSEKPGLTQAEMGQAVLPFLPDDLFPNGEKSMWWVKCVQLDLEAKGIVQRNVEKKPTRWYQKK